MRRTLLGGLAVALAVGCRTVPQMPVQLQGDPTSIAWLAGSWTGEYWGGAGGRGGSLSFTLRRGTDSLYGDVTMVDPHGQQLRPADPTDVHALHVRSPQQLRIDVVRIQADSIRGTLEPYVSPDCDCTVTTAFTGRVEGDHITGSFTSRAGGRVRAEGLWEMKRVGEGR
jgi:hypothetical protein